MNLKEKQIIYVDNKSHIKCGVVILPTTDKSAPLSINQGYLVREFYNSISKSLHHLYITSNEEIKEGDWVYYIKSNTIINCYTISSAFYETKEGENIIAYYKDDCIKIIATTDESLGIEYSGDRHLCSGVTMREFGRKSLPQPSQQFIEKYIEEYNKDNIITEILVEVEPDYNQLGESIWELKLNSQNQITIVNKKDSYTREEVIELFNKLEKEYEDILDFNFVEWIKENL